MRSVALILAVLMVPIRAIGCELAIQIAGDHEITQGGVPTFQIFVRNNGVVPCKVLDVRKREDLKDNYAEMKILGPDDRPVEMPRMISDPGPIGEQDWVNLAPGQAIAFEHDGKPWGLNRLSAGRYKVQLRFRDPFLQREHKSDDFDLLVRVK
jgi:hypothetical protein